MNDEQALYFENIDEYINSENRLVTYKWLSYQLGIHVNKSKSLLQEYIDTNGQLDLDVIYIIGGLCQDGNFAAKHQYKLSRKTSLDSTKSSFETVTCCHVYALQKEKIKDAVSLDSTDSKQEVVNENRHHVNKFSGIQCSSVQQIERTDFSQNQVVHAENKFAKLEPKKEFDLPPTKKSPVKTKKETTATSFFGKTAAPGKPKEAQTTTNNNSKNSKTKPTTNTLASSFGNFKPSTKKTETGPVKIELIDNEPIKKEPNTSKLSAKAELPEKGKSPMVTVQESPQKSPIKSAKEPPQKSPLKKLKEKTEGPNNHEKPKKSEQLEKSKNHEKKKEKKKDDKQTNAEEKKVESDVAMTTSDVAMEVEHTEEQTEVETSKPTNKRKVMDSDSDSQSESDEDGFENFLSRAKDPKSSAPKAKSKKSSKRAKKGEDEAEDTYDGDDDDECLAPTPVQDKKSKSKVKRSKAEDMDNSNEKPRKKKKKKEENECMTSQNDSDAEGKPSPNENKPPAKKYGVVKVHDSDDNAPALSASGRRRGRRKVLKSNTFMGDDGFMVTEKAYESESFTESDGEQSTNASSEAQQKTQEAKKVFTELKQQKAKVLTTKTKTQASISSFFKRK